MTTRLPAVKIMNGTDRPEDRRDQKKLEKIANFGDLKPPKILDSAGKKEYTRIVAELDKMCILSEVDKEILIIYCQLFSEYVQLSRFIQENGITGTFISDRGVEQVRLRPEYTARNVVIDKLIQLTKHLGLSPLSRASLVGLMPDVSKDDEMLAIISDIPKKISKDSKKRCSTK